MRQYKNQYGTIFAVRQKAGVPRLMCRVEEGRSWVISGVLAPRTGDAKTEQELQAVLDRTAEELGWTECKDTDAPTGAAAATTGRNAASAESTAETSTTSESGEDANNSPGLPSAPADTSPQPPKAADAVPATRTTASSASGNGSLPAFDYSGLDDQTVQDLHLAEREYMSGRKLAEVGLRRMADGVAIAHDALCGACDNLSQAHNNQHSEKTFGRWCDSVGLTRKAAERLLQVSRLFDSSTPREEQVLEDLGPSLLYAAAKPSAPTELVQAVKDGDITTHKQYRELEAKLKAERSAREKAERLAADTQREQNALRERINVWSRELQQASKLRNDAENRARMAEKERDEAFKERDGAKSAFQAAKMRGDKLKAENDSLRACPIEAAVVDEDEINRRAEARLQEALAAKQAEQREVSARNAEDAILLFGRQINTSWQMVRPFLSEMDEDGRLDAINRINKEWAQTQEEVMQCL